MDKISATLNFETIRIRARPSSILEPMMQR
jgi:hypothetical protein